MNTSACILQCGNHQELAQKQLQCQTKKKRKESEVLSKEETGIRRIR